MIYLGKESGISALKSGGDSSVFVFMPIVRENLLRWHVSCCIRPTINLYTAKQKRILKPQIPGDTVHPKETEFLPRKKLMLGENSGGRFKIVSCVGLKATPQTRLFEMSNLCCSGREGLSSFLP